MAAKIIAVVGATGAQGGGLVRAINADPDGGFVARALVRDPGSEKAQQLAAGGAEVVAADLDDPESIRGGFEGANGAFCVTFFWEHLSAEKEKEQARTMAEAARNAGLRHVIWSTLEDTREYIPLDDDRMPTLGGHYKVPHFDAKGESDRYFTDLGVPTTFLLASFYWENFIFFGLGPARGEDGRLSLTLPIGDEKNAGIGSEDIGRCAYGIFKRGSELSGRRIGIAGEHLTGEEMAAAIGRHIGEEVSFNAVDPDTFRSFGFPGADEVGNMFQFYRDFAGEVLATRDVEASRQLNPSLQSFDQWLAENAHRIPIPPR
jgi:uncharacterized protein YbjT (DUF2867 family)